jgi:hypothetical protein
VRESKAKGVCIRSGTAPISIVMGKDTFLDY